MNVSALSSGALSLRRKLISAPLLKWYRRALPPLSDTERDALEAGTVSWDAELFSGKPDWERWSAIRKPQLSDAEQAFLDGPVEELCRMVDDWQINHELRDLPPEVWSFIKDNGFFGMIIPKRYGGLEFSALAHSNVIVKLASRSISTAVTVMVPNSLGPAELLLEYGTDEQKDYYLPRLAKGEEIPCFAMTGPTAGSDAASMPDRGVICYQDFQGERTLGIRANWDKRYITLGPVATLLGVAFNVHDPDHILSGQEDLGITLALVPGDTDGVETGRRHYPCRLAFQNGPTRGKDVFIPLDWVIGGREQIGNGWRMLMEALAAGRAISLPSLSVGCTKLCAYSSGAYARIRKQFGIPVGKFEGVQEALAVIAGHCYSLEAARRITTQLIDQGEKPAVLSAILKYHATERMRETIDLAMDVHAGKAICDGPANYLANAYHAQPVAITVEGANILTRSMIIFGQGAIRSHPYLHDEIAAAHDDSGDQKTVLNAFDQALFGHIGFVLRNVGRSFWLNLSGARRARAPQNSGVTADYYRQIDRSSASFALLADSALLILGGQLKRKEMLSARFGDVLSEMYLLSCTLKRYDDENRPPLDLPLLHWCAQHSLSVIQQRFDEILQNFPSRPLGWLLRRIVFPFGRDYRRPSDQLTRQCAELILTPGESRRRLTEGLFIGQQPDDPLALLNHTLNSVIAADEVEEKWRDAGASSADQAVRDGIISEAEAQRLRQAERLIRQVIAVDEFDPEQLSGEHEWPQPQAAKHARSM